MTTTNNAAANTANTANTAKTRVTLKSTLLAGDHKALAVVLAGIGADKAAIQKFGLTFSLAVKEAQEVLKKQESEKSEKAAEIQKEKDRMLQFLMDTVNGLGMDLAAAEVAAQAAIDKKYPAASKEKKFSFNRVTVVVDGKEHEMPTSGNMTQVLKDAMQAGGFTTHKDFILAKAKDIAQAKAAYGIVDADTAESSSEETDAE